MHALHGISGACAMARTPGDRFFRSPRVILAWQSKGRFPCNSGSKRPFLREKRLSNAQARGLYEANTGHAPQRIVCWGRGIARRWNWRAIGALAQTLFWKKRCLKFI
jgi:hypothetical protein